MRIQGKDYRTVWMEGDSVLMIDQTLLPHEFRIYRARGFRDTIHAIRTMVIRGAPAIGAAAAYCTAQALMSLDDFHAAFEEACREIAGARPTAQDLFDGIRFVRDRVAKAASLDEARKTAILAAEQYADSSVDACRKIGEAGNAAIKPGARILTHCNAGALATVDIGTALAPIRAAHSSRKNIFVLADETRPRQQGSSLTAFELSEEGIPHAIIADNAAGHFMRKGMVDMCIVGADRIALNGDAANKIGTYEKAVLAKENKIPFYVAAPLSTFDFRCSTGDDIPIEERSEDEVLYAYGWSDQNRYARVRTSPLKSHARNPAFDVTPAKYITGIITPLGIIKPANIRKTLYQKN